MMKRTCYPVQTWDRGDIHIMQDDWLGTGSTPIGLLAPAKSTLCGRMATRNLSDIFTLDDVTCLECARRYDSL